jgi:carboxymethylenebutenolidase
MKAAVHACAAWLVLAAWSSPAVAQAIDTSHVRIGSAAAGTGAFVARPAGKGAAPGIVVIQEWWGLNAQIRDVARRLAREGYVAIVPDLFHGKVATDPEQAHVLTRGLEEDRAYADLEAAVAWLRASPQVADRKIGVIGFCLGGGYAQGLALRDRSLAAAVMFYGSPVTDAKALGALRCPLQAHFGEQDDGIPLEKVEALRAGLEKAGKEGEVFLYAGAGHAFMNDARPSYHRDAARQAWARTLAFLQKQLKR